MADDFNLKDFLKSQGCNCCYEHKIGLACQCHYHENKIREEIAKKIEDTCVSVVIYKRGPCSRCQACARFARGER